MNEYLSQNLGMTQQHITHNLLRLNLLRSKWKGAFITNLRSKS